jgi:lysozyme
MWGLGRAAALLAAGGALAMAAWIGATHWHPAAARYPLQGIDLPLDPGAVEWGAVRGAGADFAYLTATAGARRRDASFEANWAALPDAGLRRGAVHLYSLCEPARAQANAFNTFVPRADDALPAAVEVDLTDDCTDRPTPAALLADLSLFAQVVEAHTGKPLLLRVSRAAERRYAITAGLQRPVWAMGNFLSPGYPARPWRLWRASDLRRIDGVDQPVNWDVVAG